MLGTASCYFCYSSQIFCKVKIIGLLEICRIWSIQLGMSFTFLPITVKLSCICFLLSWWQYQESLEFPGHFQVLKCLVQSNSKFNLTSSVKLLPSAQVRYVPMLRWRHRVPGLFFNSSYSSSYLTHLIADVFAKVGHWNQVCQPQTLCLYPCFVMWLWHFAL